MEKLLSSADGLTLEINERGDLVVTGDVTEVQESNPA